MSTYQKPKPINKTSVKRLARVVRQKCTQLHRARKAYDKAHQAFYAAALAHKRAKEKGTST